MKNNFIEQYTPLVKRIAYLTKSTLPPGVDVDDLIQAGMIGLLDAVRLYDESHDRKFEIYAVRRIRGAVLDELRGCDNLSRPHREKIKRGDLDDVSVSSFDAMLEDGFDLASGDDDPFELLVKKQSIESAINFIDRLSDDLRKLMNMHYVDDVKLCDASGILGYGKQWAWQNHSMIINKLREHLS